ncbi:hypothetical protein ACIGFK_38940 [Streptomyces sp. NPDC085524]|uniref:hypothetical protein n=1 Tax=unclassified Streptomyces TaxID=2593676 RepID=UPI0035E31A7A
MTDEDGPTREATLYEAAHFRGASVTVRPDQWDEGGDAVAYSLAHLGLNRLCSLRAPSFAGETDETFRQELTWVTTVTVWDSKPRTWTPDDGERGRSWQEYSADTADLGIWATRAAFVRVWRRRAERPADMADMADMVLRIVAVE